MKAPRLPQLTIKTLEERILWPHQRAAFQNIRAYLRRRRGSEAALIHMPTGTGKTAVIAAICRCVPRVGTALILVPRSFLREQMRQDVDSKFWEKVGAAGEGAAWRLRRKPVVELLPKDLVTVMDRHARRDVVIVSTIQALGQIKKIVQKAEAKPTVGLKEGAYLAAYRKLRDQLSLVIVDEGQYEPAPDWGDSVQALAAPMVLLTATPYRNDLKTFAVDKRYVYSYTFPEAVADRYVRDVEFAEFSYGSHRGRGWDEASETPHGGSERRVHEVQATVRACSPVDSARPWLRLEHPEIPAFHSVEGRSLEAGIHQLPLARGLSLVKIAVGQRMVVRLEVVAKGPKHGRITAFRISREAERFVSRLLDFLADPPLDLKPRKVGGELVDPKVIVRCDSFDSVNEVAGLLRQRQQSVVAIHESFPARTAAGDYRYRRVPPPRERSEKFWVHQNKLVEGVDDWQFRLLAIYRPFKSARPFIQQVGRVIRNPQVGKRRLKDQKAWVFVDRESDLREFWENFIRFEHQISADPQALVSTAERPLHEMLAESQPRLFYLDGNYRSALDVREALEAPEEEILFRMSTSVYRVREGFDRKTLRASIERLFAERDRKSIPGPNETPSGEGVYLYLEWENSRILRKKAFIECRLGYTFFRQVDDLLFYSDAHGLVPDYLRRQARPVPAEELQRLFPETAATRVTQMSMYNSDLGRHAIRSRTIRALDIQETAPTMRDHGYLPTTASGLASVDGVGRPVRRYIGFSRGKITDSSQSSGSYRDFIAWLDELKEELRSHRHQPLRIFDRYAEFAKTPRNPEPASILLDIEDVRDSFRVNSEDPTDQEALEIESICVPVRDGKFTIRANGKDYRVKIRFLPRLERYHLDSPALSEAYVSGPEIDKDLVHYLNRTQSFRVVPRDYVRIDKKACRKFVTRDGGQPLELAELCCPLNGDTFELRPNGKSYKVRLSFDSRSRKYRLHNRYLAMAFKGRRVKNDLLGYLNAEQAFEVVTGDWVELGRQRLEEQFVTSPAFGVSGRPLRLAGDRFNLRGNTFELRANDWIYAAEVRGSSDGVRISCPGLAADFRLRDGHTNLVSYLNRSREIEVYRTSEYIYAHGEWYRPRVAMTGARGRRLEILNLFEPVNALAKASSEKGRACRRGGAGWERGSVFDLIDPLTPTPKEMRPWLKDTNLVVCDDMFTEVADFIAADTAGHRVMFIHAKAFAKKKERSASAFHEVCAQAVKNLDYASPYSDRQPPNLARWSDPWEAYRADNGGRKLIGRVKRVRRGHGRPETIWSRIKELERDPTSSRGVWVVLGQGFSKGAFQKRIDRGKLAPEDVQILYLIQSSWSSVSQMGASFRVFCSP